jgi:hypothetical protein
VCHKRRNNFPRNLITKPAAILRNFKVNYQRAPDSLSIQKWTFLERFPEFSEARRVRAGSGRIHLWPHAVLDLF